MEASNIQWPENRQAARAAYPFVSGARNGGNRPHSIAKSDTPAHARARAMMVISVWIGINWWAVDLVNHDGGRRFPNNNRFGLLLFGWFLHRGNNPAAHPLLAQVDEVLRTGRLNHTVGSDVIDNQLLVNAALRHHDDVFGGDRPSTELPSQLGLDLGSVAGFDLIQFRSDHGPAQRSDPGTYGGSGTSIARCIPDEGPGTCSKKAAQKGSLVSTMG